MKPTTIKILVPSYCDVQTGIGKARAVNNLEVLYDGYEVQHFEILPDGSQLAVMEMKKEC